MVFFVAGAGEEIGEGEFLRAYREAQGAIGSAFAGGDEPDFAAAGSGGRDVLRGDVFDALKESYDYLLKNGMATGRVPV